MNIVFGAEQLDIDGMKPLRVQIQIINPNPDRWMDFRMASWGINWNDELARSEANQKIREALEKGYDVALYPISK